MEPPPLLTSTTSTQPSTPLSTDSSPPQQPPAPPSQPQPQPQPQPQSQSQSQPSSASSLPRPQLQPPPTPNLSSSSPVPVPVPILNSNPNSNPTNSLSPFPQHPPGPPNNRGQSPFSKSWSQPTSQFSHFPSQFHSAPPSASTSSSSSPSPSLPPPRGGIAIGVPAHHPSPPPSQPPPAFSSSFGAQYVAGLPRNPPVSMADPSIVSSSCPSPARPPMQGIPSMGMIGSQVQPGGVPPSSLHQQRPVQAASGIRPQAASNSLPSVPQNFQGGHGMLRTSSVTPSSTSTPNTSQNQLSSNRPWLSAPLGHPPLPSQSIRPQVNSQSLQQRSHIPQQSPQPLQAAEKPQQLLPSPQQQQQFPASNQSQDNHGQQLPSSRVQQPLANQQQIVRVQGAANQRPPLPAVAQPSIVQSGPTENSNASEISESCNTILSKRNIQELMNQIDPYEKLDPEVEDVLVDIAEDFIDSVTTFGCSLAKHRKSNTLEAKDILLHLERTWNMTLPGFSGDEIKTYKKPVANEIHKERLALIKKSVGLAEPGNNKSSAGPAAGNVKGHLAKATTNIVGS